MMTKQSDQSIIDVLSNLAEESFSISELREMFKISHTYISSIELEKSAIHGKRCLYIKIIATSGRIYEYKSRYECGGQHRHLYYRKHTSGVVSAFDDFLEIHPAILIQRPLGRKATGYQNVHICRQSTSYYAEWYSTTI